MNSSLSRFLLAQEDTFSQAESEIRAGKKTSHWMWFIFPQIAGLGLSALSQKYAISSLDEAVAFLHHPILGKRFFKLVNILVNEVEGKTAYEIFGSPDDLKFRSSITLFKRAAQQQPDYAQEASFQILKSALDKYFNGVDDEKTISLLNTSGRL